MPPSFQYHVFSLPQELLESLTPRNLVTQAPVISPSRAESPDIVSQTAAGARTCNICLGASFIDVGEQRNHYRSDWHRYNVKVRLNGGKAVGEADFSKLVDGLEDSISGSASSSDDSDSEESDTVRTLLQKARVSSRSPSPSSGPAVPQTALAWFHSPPSTQIGVYKAIFDVSSSNESYVEDLKAMQKDVEEGRTWAMFMVAGGHFAGAIVRVSSPAEDGEDSAGMRKKPKRPKPDTEVLRHKTFHRYTTRRKQGGSQSVNDNAKHKAKSAGAQLRRYGEQALRDDIRNLLRDWAEEIDQCERIWIRASTSNKRIFMDYDDAVFNKRDERLRTFPFMTRRPTQAELGRCLLELTKVKVSHLTEDALRAQDEAFLASLPKPRLKPQPSPALPPVEKEKEPKLSKEEELFRDKWTRLIDMVTKGRLDALKSLWERESSNIGGVNAPVPEWTGEKYGTLLQLASHSCQEDVTRWLLEEARADPTIEVPVAVSVEDGNQSDASDTAPTPVGSRRTAYDLARTRGVRDIFRRCAGAHPDWWDWFTAGHVPSALSKEMEEGREEKKKVRRKGLKDKLKEREAKEKEMVESDPVEEVTPKQQHQGPDNSSGARKLGGSSGSTEGVVGLTPEMRARVERERRARAAEARMKALSGGK